MRWWEPCRNSPSVLAHLGVSQLSKAHIWFNFRIVLLYLSVLLYLRWGLRFCCLVSEFSGGRRGELSHPLHLFVPVVLAWCCRNPWSADFFFKSLSNLLQYCFCFLFQFVGQEACGILVPQSGIEPTHSVLEGKVSTTGPPGKSLPISLKT